MTVAPAHPTAPATPPAAPARHGTWPAEHLYWAELDPGLLPPRHRRDPERLGYLLEGALPVPLDDVAAAYCAAGDRIVACAIDRSALDEALRSRAGLRWTSLCPAGPPPAAAGIRARVIPRRLNLLAGAYRPPAVARRGRLAWLLATIAVLGAGGLLAAGFERRAGAARTAAATIRSETAAALQSAVPPGRVPADASAGRLEIALEAELEGLRRTRGSGTGTNAATGPASAAATDDPVDATRALAAVIAAWPDARGVRVRALQSGGDRVTITGLAPSAAAVERVRAAVDAVPGWRARTQRTDQRRETIVEFTLSVERARGAATEADS